MANPGVPKRLQWAVQLLDIAPSDEILEIGPGPGVAVSLVCGQLADGHITGIDRSATAIQRATKRNADHVASGKAVFRQLDLADVELARRALDGQRFDKVFAVNVNLFWVGPADAELQLIKDLLPPVSIPHSGRYVNYPRPRHLAQGAGRRSSSAVDGTAVIDPDPARFGVRWNLLGEAVQAGAAAIRFGGRIGDVLRFMGSLSAPPRIALSGEQGFAIRTEMEGIASLGDPDPPGHARRRGLTFPALARDQSVAATLVGHTYMVITTPDEGKRG